MDNVNSLYIIKNSVNVVYSLSYKSKMSLKIPTIKYFNNEEKRIVVVNKYLPVYLLKTNLIKKNI